MTPPLRSSGRPASCTGHGWLSCKNNAILTLIAVQISWWEWPNEFLVLPSIKEVRKKRPTWEEGILARYRHPGSHPCQWTMSSPPPGPGHTRTLSWPGCSSRCRSWATCRPWTWRGRCSAPPTEPASPGPALRPESAWHRSHYNPGSRPRECMDPGNETIKLCPETQQTKPPGCAVIAVNKEAQVQISDAQKSQKIPQFSTIAWARGDTESMT